MYENIKTKKKNRELVQVKTSHYLEITIPLIIDLIAIIVYKIEKYCKFIIYNKKIFL